MKLNAVKHVYIWKKPMPINHLNNFRNANTLTLGHDINYIPRSNKHGCERPFTEEKTVVHCLSTRKPYTISVFLCIGSYCSVYGHGNILELLHYALNISSINIQAIFVCNRAYSTIQKTEYYNDLLNNNDVKCFTRRDNCDFYTINMILNLFNKINYLKLNINVQQIADRLIGYINFKKKKNC